MKATFMGESVVGCKRDTTKADIKKKRRKKTRIPTLREGGVKKKATFVLVTQSQQGKKVLVKIQGSIKFK